MSVMQPPPEPAVTLSRRLCARLLQTAQLAPAASFKALLVSASELTQPDAILPLDEDWNVASARTALLAKGRYPWALYRHGGKHAGNPRPEDFELGPGSLYLAPARGANGRLQLRAWRCDAQHHVHEVALEFGDC
ncbi:MAG: hypothetical protein EPN72_05530 [Nevskiaceae bacterium]|nr:MAG: hypothetical protein EPN63_03665 [Nevskiaceae bacterium]TBR73597.1 MAG: hypothetical protein EPN72_05530 [Nevskiaceae bacterium]